MKIKIFYITIALLSLTTTTISAIVDGAKVSIGGDFISCFVNNIINYLVCYIFFNIIFENFSKKHPTQVSIYSFLFSFILSYFCNFDLSNLSVSSIVSLILNIFNVVLYVINYHLHKETDSLQKDIADIEKKYNVKIKTQK